MRQQAVGEVFLYSAGPCSVCAEASEAIIAMDPESGRLFFFCPACGIGWESPPIPLVVNEIDPVAKFAPKGLILPTREQIRAKGIENLIVKEIRDPSWLSLVSQYVKRS